jgi:hypothetical protein
MLNIINENARLCVRMLMLENLVHFVCLVRIDKLVSP